MFCSICNSEVRLDQVSIYSASYAIMRAGPLCFECAFWTRTIHEDSTGRDWFIVNGVHYVIGPEDATGFRGFAGAKVEVTFFDGRVVVTSNLWSQGDVSPHFRAFMPDNATMKWL